MHGTKRPTISVVILNWNRPEDTVLAVESVLRQDYPEKEIVVWDNASTDDSVELLRRRFGDRQDVHIIAADANYGVAGGRNRAFREASGDILFSLDSDAQIESGTALRDIAVRFSRDENIGALSFEVRRPDGHIMWPFSRPKEEWKDRAFETTRVDGCSFAVPRSAFASVNAFPEHFSPYGIEDQHFALQLVGLGYTIFYMPDVVVTHAFAETGRSPLQFRRHVRNSLWIPLELFPWPHALLSVCKTALLLLQEACQQRQLLSYTLGVIDALVGFRIGRRNPISSSGWKRLRSLIENEKSLVAS